MKISSKNTFARIKNIFDASGMTKVSLGEKLGASSSNSAKLMYANRILEGKKKLSIEELQKISIILNKPPEYFLFGKNYEVIQKIEGNNNQGNFSQGNDNISINSSGERKSLSTAQIRKLISAGMSDEEIENFMK